jgi:hypothetical protein
MKQFIIVVLLFATVGSLPAQEVRSSNLRQYYSGKFGYYRPAAELNDGLILGIDGVTEFIHYRFTLTGAIDIYQKQTIGVYKNDRATNIQQTVVLIPMHVSAGYKLLELPDADTRAYAGAGLGYNLFFYTVQYSESSSGGIFGEVVSRDHSDSRNGGNFLGTFFLRILIGRVFVEPRFYVAAMKQGSLGNGSYTIDPSGFAVTLGFQYQ